MNILSYAHGRVSAKLFAGITIVSLLASALPVAFFVAEAATEIDFELSVVPNPVGADADLEYLTLSNLSPQDVDLTGWTLVEDGTELTLSGTLPASGESLVCANTIFAENGGMNCDYEFPAGFNLTNSAGSVSLIAPDYTTVVTVTWTDEGETDTAVNDSGSLAGVLGTTGGDKIAICHGTASENNPYVSQSPNLNSFFSGGHDSDTDDIIPPFFYNNGSGVMYFAGSNWDAEGQEKYENDCEIPNTDTTETCNDGIQNQDETDIDQGGICEPEVAVDVEPELCSLETAGTLIDFTANPEKNSGQPVDTNRRDPVSVTLTNDNRNFFGKEVQNAPIKFFSLGIEGFAVFEFENKVVIDGPGDDIAIWETTWGNATQQSDEKAIVSVSQDNVTYVEVETLTGDGGIDISGTGLDYVKYIKFEDDSRGVQGANGDGFDLDYIGIIDDSCSDLSEIIVTKIVCEDESLLPNDGYTAIDASTAAAFLASTPERTAGCQLEAGMEFQWAYGEYSSSNVPSNSGAAPAPWMTSASTNSNGETTITLLANDFDGETTVSVREVLDTNDYLGFSGKNGSDVTAEMYCNADAKFFDNMEWIEDVENNKVYHCVAWNVPVEPEQTLCTVTLTSDDSNTVVEKGGAFAVVLDFINNRWTESLLNADWIWGDQGPTDPTQAETQTFVNQFGWNGDVITDATLTIAADNSFSASLNGDAAGEDLTEFNYGATKDYDVTSLIDNGNNELSVIVENFAGNSNPENNPAGLYYELVINGEGENCDVPFVPEPEEPEEPEYGPYCGDGEVSGWEQCEIGNEGCTDYCTLDNQCSSEQLIKITLDDNVPEQTSFNETIYLGSDTNPIPNGTWFNFSEVGDDSFVTTANAVEGLAVERDTVNGKLALAFVGGNGPKKIDNAKGTIMTKGIILGSVDRTPNTSFKLENGSGITFNDVFDKNPDESIDFDLRADTGDDGVTVEIEAGDEYDCPLCKATVEARVVLNENGQTGNGDLNERVILGDAGYTTVEYGEWFPVSVVESGDTSATMINDPNTVTNFANPGDKAGLFVSREAGTVKVALYGEHNPGGNTNNEWIDARIEVRDAGITNFSNLSGNFKLENHSETDNVPTNDFSDVATADGTGVDFRLWVDTASDGFRFNIDHDSIVSCEDDTVNISEPVPVCAPGDTGYDPENDLTGSLTGTGEGTVINSSDVCAYEIGLASYKKFDNIIDNQELFDAATTTIAANDTEILTVDVPQCAYQIDLFYGDLLTSLDGQRYGTRLLEASNEGGTNYCPADNGGTGGGGNANTGTLKVCKVLVNESGDIIDGGNAEFSVVLTGSNFTETAVFSNLTYNTNLFGNDQVNDTQCISYEVKPGKYSYAEEMINAGQSTFGAPMYHDGFRGVADELSDMVLFDSNNNQSDGNVWVNKGKTRTIVVKNTLEGEVLGETSTTTINVMKHICNASIKDLADFNSVDGPDNNQTTEFHDKVLACPTVVMDGDDYTDGLAFAGKRAFDFEVKGDAGETQTIANATFIPGKVCEDDINFDANGDSTIDSNTCFDISLYSYTNVTSGDVTVTELVSPTGRIGGALEFTPAAINGGFDESIVLNDSNRFDDGVVEIDTTLDNNGIITLHLYNFLTEEVGVGGVIGGNVDDNNDSGGSTATRLDGRGGGSASADGDVAGLSTSNEGSGGDFPLVQGNQVSLFPAGAPNTGAGGTAPSTPNYLALFSLLALLLLVGTKKEMKEMKA